jgi:UDP-N-acetylmuramate--alanine ligase
MISKIFSSVKKIHFVGIGGIGMSGIAEILLNQGFIVSGSDMARSENTDYLESLGSEIYIGHSEDNVKDAEVVVYSSAVDPMNNPETLAALKLNIPLLRRAEMLAEVSRLNYCLAISGTHGKTTTTSLCGLTMLKGGLDPTVIVGGRLRGFGGTNARLGRGDWTVVEADEFDRSFLQLLPTIAVVNNIEPEHLDIYKDFDDLKNTFLEFSNKVPFYGFVAVCLDDIGVKSILGNIKKKVITYGLSRHANVRAENIKFDNIKSEFKTFYEGEELGQVRLNIPGVHNIRNSLAAIAIGLELKIPFEQISEALSEFTGVNRRFEIKGNKNGIMVVDDYAHHPTEVQATIAAARNGWNKRIISVFQPHTYTRTRDFYKDFGKSFDDSDILIVTDVYPAREKPIEGVNGKLIADTAISYGHKNVIYAETLDEAYNYVKEILKEGDLLLTLGAGDIWKLANRLAAEI